jgi:hypothetical protein
MTLRRDPPDPVLGDRVIAAPGLLAISPWRLREDSACARRAYYAHVLGLRTPGADRDTGSDDAADAALIGREAHAELHARHVVPGSHDLEGPVRTDPVGGGEVAKAVQRIVRAHASLCPSGSGATHVGGELDLVWFIHRKLILVTGRVDALWRTSDGSYEVREYKTGRGAADAVADDPAPGIYGLLVRARHPDAEVRVVYELLGGDAPRPLEIEVTPALEQHAIGLVLGLADRLRTDRRFEPSPDRVRCRSCPYLRSCPDGSEAVR